MNKFSHPGPNLEDHFSLERLVSSERGAINGIFIEDALIIGFDPDIFSFQYCNAPIFPHYLLNLQRKFRIILAPTKVPLTLQDAEVILEKQKISDRDAEIFLQGLEEFQDKCLTKVDQPIEPGLEEKP